MESDDKYVTVYTGPEVNVQHLQNIFKEVNIDSISKNNFESGLRSGFGGGLPGQVQLLVFQSQSDSAKKIIADTFPPQEKTKQK